MSHWRTDAAPFVVLHRTSLQWSVMQIKRLACVLAASCSLLATAASGATITFQFAGTVTYGAPMAVPTGSQIVGTYTYDTETAPTISYNGFADYQLAAPATMSATVAGHTMTTGNLNVSLWNHYKGNVEDMIDVTGSPVVLDGTTFPNGALGFRLASAPKNNRALNGTKLPSLLDVSQFDAGLGLNYGFFQSDGGPQGMLMQFTVDSVIVISSTP